MIPIACVYCDRVRLKTLLGLQARLASCNTAIYITLSAPTLQSYSYGKDLIRVQEAEQPNITFQACYRNIYIYICIYIYIYIIEL